MSIKIQYGKLGYFLVINNKAIKIDKTAFCGFTTTELPFGRANNWIATEFASIKALRDYWTIYRELLITKTK
jgi:hypothetical protein